MQLRLLARILPGVATASVISALAVATASNQPSYAEEKSSPANRKVVYQLLRYVPHGEMRRLSVG